MSLFLPIHDRVMRGGDVQFAHRNRPLVRALHSKSSTQIAENCHARVGARRLHYLRLCALQSLVLHRQCSSAIVHITQTRKLATHILSLLDEAGILGEPTTRWPTTVFVGARALPEAHLPLFEAARRAYVHGATARAHVGRQARPARGAARDSSHHSPIKENCRGLGLPDPINHVYSLPGKYI